MTAIRTLQGTQWLYYCEDPQGNGYLYDRLDAAYIFPTSHLAAMTKYWIKDLSAFKNCELELHTFAPAA